MALTTKEIPELFFWIVVLGIGVYVTTKIVGKVGEKISDVFV